MPRNVVMDGDNMLPTLADGKASPRSQMCWKRRNDTAIRLHNWKLVNSSAGSGLFNLSGDPGESHDLTDERPDKLQELKSAFDKWLVEMEQAEPRGPFRDF